MNLKHPVVKNMMSLFIQKGANYLVYFITVPYLVHVLGPQTYGKVIFAQVFIQYFVMFVNFGFNLSATRSIAIHQEDREEVLKIFNSVIFIKFFLMLISFLLLLLVVYFVPKFSADKNLYLLAFLSVVGNMIFPTWFFQGIEKMRYIASLNIIAQAITTVCIFLFVHSEGDYLRAVGIQGSYMIVSGLMAIRPIMQMLPIKFYIPKFVEFKKNFVDAWFVFILAGSINVYDTSSIFLLGLMTNNVLVTYFSLAYKLLKAIAGLMAPVFNAIYPHISMLASQSSESALKLIRTSLKWAGMLSFGMTLLFLLFAGPIVHFLFGAQYDPVVAVIHILAFNLFFIALGYVLGMETMLTFGLNREYSHITLGTLIFNLVITFVFIRWWSINGAALSTLLTEILVVTWMYFVISHKKLSFWSSQKPLFR